MIETETVALLMMRVVANRHVATCTDEDFVQLTVDLVRAAKREQAARAVPSMPAPLASAEYAARSQRDRSAPAERGTPSKKPVRQARKNPKAVAERVPAKRRTAAPDEEVRRAMHAEIRERYDEAQRVKTGKRLPRGFVDGLAREYGLTKKQVLNIACYKPRGAPAPKKTAPSVSESAAPTEPRTPRAVAAQPASAKKLTDAEKEELCAQYESVRAGGAPTPPRWVDDKAEELGVSRKAILEALAPAVDRLKERSRMNHALGTAPPRSDRLTTREVAGNYGGG